MSASQLLDHLSREKLSRENGAFFYTCTNTAATANPQYATPGATHMYKELESARSGHLHINIGALYMSMVVSFRCVRTPARKRSKMGKKLSNMAQGGPLDAKPAAHSR